MKKFSFAFITLASALAIAPSSLRADTITITFTPDSKPSTVVTTTAAGEISFDTGVSINVFYAGNSDSNATQALSNIAGDISIAGSYNNGTSADELISITSSTCGGVCVTGILNTGDYAAKKGASGSYQGLFTVTSASPSLLAFFGDAGIVPDSGSDAFNTSKNSVGIVDDTGLAGGTSTLSSGEVNFDVTPEPSSLILLGTGLLGLLFMGFRKRGAAAKFGLRS